MKSALGTQSLFLSEKETAQLLGIHPSTLHRLAHAGKAPIEAVWLTDHIRRYRRLDVERLAGLLPAEQL